MADPDYFTVTEFRALPDMSDATTYTEAKILNAAAYFTEIVEKELWAMIPRSFTETLDGDWSTSLFLEREATSLTSVTVDGTAVSTSLLTCTSGVVRYKSPGQTFSGAANGNVVVVYVAGEAAVPDDIKDAVMWATRDRLLAQSDQSGIDVRKTSVNTDFGTTNYILAGERRPTGYPELDAILLRRSRGPGGA